MTEPDHLTVFVNERPIRVRPAAPALEAVQALDPALADAVRAGRGYLTDGRGIGLEPAAPLSAGAIIRAVISARHAREADAQP